jgi:hypothetical protein
VEQNYYAFTPTAPPYNSFTRTNRETSHRAITPLDAAEIDAATRAEVVNVELLSKTYC